MDRIRTVCNAGGARLLHPQYRRSRQARPSRNVLPLTMVSTIKKSALKFDNVTKFAIIAFLSLVGKSIFAASRIVSRGVDA